MKKELRQKVLLFLILFGLLVMGLLSLFVPKNNFSVRERRFLSNPPCNPSLTDWTFKDDLENYISDRLPMRSLLISLNSTYDLVLGRRVQQEVWPVQGMLIEKPVVVRQELLLRRLSLLSDLCEEHRLPVQIMVIPSAGAVMQPHMPFHLAQEYASERNAHVTLDNFPDVIPMNKLLCSNPQDTYFATDHHWNLNGAYLAYESYCDKNKLSPFPLSDYQLIEFENFMGSTFSRSGLFIWTQDTLRCAQPKDPIHFTILDSEESIYDTMIFEENRYSWDPYTIFLKGNHGMAVIENTSAPDGHLLVFKDSFANTLLPLLSAHYNRITIVDLRYYAGTFSDAITATNAPDQILFCLSMDSLLNDTTLVRKLK